MSYILYILYQSCQDVLTCTDYKMEFLDIIFCGGEKTYHKRYPCHCIDERV